MDLSIIIVNWNSRAFLEKCLAAVYANTRDFGLEVIVVDNASWDGCAGMLARSFPKARFVQSLRNIGFAGANNLGFAQASGRVVLFLNPDTEVIGDALSTLLAAIDGKPDAGVVGARLLNADGTVQTSCIQRFPSLLNQAIDANILRTAFPRLRVWGTRPLLERPLGPVAVEAVSGACMMVRRNVFEQLGLFSANYFMYSEDVDLCFKACRAGFTNYYVDAATVLHYGGASSGVIGQNTFPAVALRESLLRFFALRRGAVSAVAYRVSTVLISIARCTILICALPLAGRHRHLLRSALCKWFAVLRWGMGLAAVPDALSPKVP